MIDGLIIAHCNKWLLFEMVLHHLENFSMEGTRLLKTFTLEL